MSTPVTRVEARRLIVQAANRHLLRRHARRWWPVAGAQHVRLLNQRQIQQAVTPNTGRTADMHSAARSSVQGLAS